MENNYMSTWKKSSIRIGTPTNLIAALTAFLPVLYLCMKYSCWPPIETVLAAWGMVIVSYSAFYIVEPVSYYAALGLSGTYMGFLSGNLGNMRVPCAAIALDVTKSEAGTIQAEVASTMAVAGSIITNLIATTLAAIVGTAIVAILPENIKIGLQSYAAAGIYAASLGNFALKSPKLAGLAILIALVCRWFIPGMPSWCAIVISVFGTVFLSRAFYNSDKKKAAT